MTNIKETFILCEAPNKKVLINIKKKLVEINSYLNNFRIENKSMVQGS